MITVRKLSKSIGGNKIIDGLDLNAEAGTVYGLTGLNGAGKTTLLLNMAGVERPDAGSILYDGEHVWENAGVKDRLIFMPDSSGYLDSFTLREAADFYQRVYSGWDGKRLRTMTDDFSVDPGEKIATFSRGAKKQIAFMLMMSTHPLYILLDEVTDALDPMVKDLVWRYIMEDVRSAGTTVVASSHNLHEMEGRCDRIGIMNAGRMLLERDIEDMKKEIHKIQVAFSDLDSDPARYDRLHVMKLERKGSVDILLVRNSREEIRDWVLPQNPVIFDMLPVSLEEIFLCELRGSGNELGKIFV